MPSDNVKSKVLICPYPNTVTMDGKISKPSRKNFERQCKDLADEIHVIHTKLASNKALLNELFAKLDKLREERNAKFTEKSLVEGSVKDMSVNINKLSEKLAQLQSKLHYRDMNKLEDAIRTLQVHLDSRHFKHSEEKKIVAEIDKLNRSKKVVGEYLGTQSELKELRSSQHGKRADRDKLIKDIVTIRKQEEETRANIATYKTQDSQLRTDLEAMNENKWQLKEQFTKHQQTFAEQKAAIKQAEIESRQKQQQTRLGHCVQSRCLSNGPQTVTVKPQTQEMIHCQKLIEFCERLNKNVGNDKSAHRQRKKKIMYTPDILSQFVSIDICPPMTVAQAAGCIPLLQQKLVELHQSEQLRMTPVLEVVPQSQPDITVPSLQANPETVMLDDDSTHLDITHIQEEEVESEQPNDQSDRASIYKQLSNTSDEDAIESITYKLAVLDSLCHIEDLRTSDNFIA